jgi:hypothetical protein
MKLRVISVLLWMVLLSCRHPQDDWHQHQDRSIKMPRFDASTRVDQIVDGPTLQALRIAADDFLPPSTKPRPCSETQAAHDYEVSREGDIIFVRISENPERCGGKYHSLDGAVRYAISKDGRILRRVLDGEPADAETDDGGLPRGSVELLARPDGGAPILDSSVRWDWSLTPPWLLDGGVPVDGGVPGPHPDGGAFGSP